jgi:hypothetical protein
VKTKVLIDVTISCDPPHPYIRQRSMEALAKYYEGWVRDFHDFIRDHRSQDPVSLNVERKYQDQCSFCGYPWEEKPECCDEAIAEWEKEHETTKEEVK